jgi:hypothetical protein
MKVLLEDLGVNGVMDTHWLPIPKYAGLFLKSKAVPQDHGGLTQSECL